MVHYSLMMDAKRASETLDYRSILQCMVAPEYFIANVASVFSSIYCRLVIVMGRDCRLSTAALGLLYYPRMIAM
jgi:hypothetical protein